ncbi:MAG TPA: 30S ribosomal protein THX [Bacteroidia bacterium]
MGKGDKRSKKGKITIGSYGVRRPRPSAKAAVAAPVASEKKKAKAAAPKAEKPAAKKVTKKKAEE